MSDTINTEATQVAPVTQEATQEATTSGLPSDVQAQEQAQAALNFEVTDTIKEKHLKGDKLLGKYDNLEQLLDAHKNLQDKHAQYVDTVKTEDKGTKEAIEANLAQVKQLEVVKSLIPAYLDNGMQLTDEMAQTIADEGIDIRDVKLGAVDLRERISKAYEVVGGQENYKNMMAWAGENLDDAQKAAFDADILSVSSEFAIKGLNVVYQEAIASGETPRIQGNHASTTVRGYANKRELLADKAYVDSPKGKRDTAAINQYKQRLALTDEIVWRGR